MSKDRFLEEVWRGTPVTDEALTQCIRTLRKRLGDDAARPRFIETVAKHGYRFIAPVEEVEPGAGAAPAAVGIRARDWRRALLLASAAAAGGGSAGVFGGLLYGFAGTAASGMGAVSVLLVLLLINVAMGLAGGFGVGLGVAAAAGLAERAPGVWAVAGGACGGLIVGAVVKLLGLDAFALLFGGAPRGMTGAPEGALLGAAVGLGVWLGARGPEASRRLRTIFAAGFCGAGAGVAVTLAGGRLMGGSLDLFGRTFPSSRLQVHEIGALFGEADFGPVSRMATAGLEGLLFSAFVAGALVLARARAAGEAR